MFWKESMDWVCAKYHSENKTIQGRQECDVILHKPEYAAFCMLRDEQILNKAPSFVYLISCQAWSVLVTVWNVFIILLAGWGTSLKICRPFAIMQKKVSQSAFVGYWCVLLIWRSLHRTRSTYFVSSGNQIIQGRKFAQENRTRNVWYSLLILYRYTITLWRWPRGPCQARYRCQQLLRFLGNCIQT